MSEDQEEFEVAGKGRGYLVFKSTQYTQASSTPAPSSVMLRM